MLNAAKDVQFFVLGRSFQDYESDTMLRRAVERSVEIVGEAARRVSKSFAEANPQIPWSKIVVQRHRLAHEYDTIDDGLIWRVATVHVPLLIVELERLNLSPPG
jgi:uncharacterized protein with HEPN domain